MIGSVTATNQARVAVIYDAFPHYRNGVIDALAASDRYDYYFFSDATYRDPSIKQFEFKSGQKVIRTRSFMMGPFYVQRGILTHILKHDISHCIFLGNPWFLSYWLLTPTLRLLGRRVHFWSHGWLSKHEPLLRRTFKQLFFALANGLLLYGHRSKEIGVSHGFQPERLHVLNNSLDYTAQKRTFDGLAGITPCQLRSELGLPLHAKIIICTARVTAKCRFDLLIDALHRLRTERLDLYVVIVGDGPERVPLTQLAESLQVKCRFWGECYDEAVIGRLYKASDLTVSPGKVGLTAMHSMAYGTPVISHDNFDHQMPEVEAIVPGVTGAFFAEGSGESLARAIQQWFREHAHKPEQECIRRIECAFTPEFQRTVIETALSGAASR